MKSTIRRPRKSLRTILMMWLLLFAIVPLAFVTGYSLVKYEQAIDQELVQRLLGNGREIQVILQELNKELALRNLRHAEDKTIIYFISSNAYGAARDLAMKWMREHFTNRLSIFNREGQLEVALYRESGGDVARQEKLESGDVYLSEKFLSESAAQQQRAIIDFTKDGNLDLIMFSKITTSGGIIVGYIEEILRIDKSFIQGLKRRLNIEAVFFSNEGSQLVSSHDDLKHYRQGFFLEKYSKQNDQLFGLNIRDNPYGFMVQALEWGGEKFYVAVGASKQASKNVLKNINYAFFTVVGATVILLIILSFIFSKIMLQPLNALVELVQNVDFNSPPAMSPHVSDNELGILTDSFNEMVSRVHNAQNELKENIKKLESANVEIRETQAKLVHTAKMASLGQLVAGVAHELNNPIGYIFSNMTHLREYSQRLITLVNTAEKDVGSLPKQKEKLEFDYIVGDLPKLIKSCEDGARRTRDIVLGLRNFSRLEEAKLKEVDIHEGIDSTLALLAGELKSRIKVHKSYSELPLISCYPSQLNQVFMNILSNAIHAIKDSGDIFISTRKSDEKHIEISIRDTGSGMPEETKEKLFDPFFTTKEVNRGTGLGMSITYGVVKKHNGDIVVKSQLGKGSEFIITLPIQLIS
ncbi:MAG: two-component sensor histidine kinase [Bdellovibrionales bacterium RBG_16_40_8]|nr:MAG: two-component sensor histidine kinase [Bdellovibrionales bacterium RBG_16_40_8]